MIKIAILVVALVFVHHVAAQSSCTVGVTPDVCKYGSTTLLTPFAGTTARQTCININSNPFDVNPIYGNGVSDTVCSTAVEEDGKACIRFYAELQCSGGCSKCNTGICPRFCNNFASTCPTATERGCFARIFCAANGEPCTDWDVSNDLPSPITTTTTSTTRTTTSGSGTTTHTTTTDTDDSAAGSFSVSAITLFFAVIFIFA